MAGSQPAVRVRVVARRRFRRPFYEVEIAAAVGVARQRTRNPVTLLDDYLGVGDAWAIVHAAANAWDGQHGEWVSLSDGTESR